MRKLYLLIMTLLLSSIIFPANIHVTTPDALDYWDIGETVEIEWNSTGDMNSNVKIRLYNEAGISKILDITDSTPTVPGKFNWTLPQTLQEGKYIIRVKTVDNLVFNDSAVFEIQDRRLIKIHLISPAGGMQYQAPGTMLIKWDMEHAHLVEHVRFILKKGGIAKSETVVNNNGSVTAPLTDNINDGTDYSVRIEDANDPSVFDESGYFTIYHNSIAGITLLKPDKSEYGLGQVMKIQWESTGFDGNVDVSLMKDNSKVRTIVETSTQNPFNWLINNVPTGEYQVRIWSMMNNSISDTSKKFLINNAVDLITFSKRGIFERDGFMKGQNLTLRFRVKNPSDQSIPVSIKVRFYKGKVNRLNVSTLNRRLALASTGYHGSSTANVNASGETLFDLPVTINDSPGDYTVIITVLPSDSSNTLDPSPGNNTIYGYFKVYLKVQKLKKFK